MPERQSSPGEVTSRPDAAGTENENDQVPAAQERTSGADGGTESAVTVGEQVAGQVEASPPATEPGPVEPTADAPTGAEPVLDATTAVEIAQPATEGTGGVPAQNPTARPAEQAPSGPPAEGARPAPRPRPRPRSEPDGPDADESPTVRTAVGGSARGDDEAPTDAHRSPLPTLPPPHPRATSPGPPPRPVRGSDAAPAGAARARRRP